MSEQFEEQKKFLMELIRTKAAAKYSSVRELFRHLDTARSSSLDPAEFKYGMERCVCLHLPLLPLIFTLTLVPPRRLIGVSLDPEMVRCVSRSFFFALA